MRILTFAFHGAYEYELSKTGNSFFRLSSNGIKPDDFGSRPFPENYRILSENPRLGDYDLFLCDSPKRYWEVQRWDIPKVVTCHTHLTSKDKGMLKKIPQWVPKVFISHSNFQQSGLPLGMVIYHSIDTSVYSGYNGEKGSVLMVGNHVADRGECNFKLFRRIVGELPFQIVGDNPELPSDKTFKAGDYEQLKQAYREHRVYLNTVEAPVTMGMLEAMAGGMPVLSLNYGDVPEIVQNGRNGFCSGDWRELRENLIWLMNNPQEARRIGEAGRKTVEALFSPQVFTQRWNHVFDLAVTNYHWFMRRNK